MSTVPLQNGKSLGQQQPIYRTVRKRVSTLKPAPENLLLYQNIDPNNSDNISLRESIDKNGLHEPLLVTKDGVVFSGNRRLFALKQNGQILAPCRVHPFCWEDLPKDERVALLRDCNRQRCKSVAEQVRETIVDIDPDKAVLHLHQRRIKPITDSLGNGSTGISIEGTKRRWNISPQKAEHVKYVRKVVFEDRVDYWPLSVRGIHYPLLNYRFYRNIPRKLWYENNDNSYSATSDLLTRLRLTGEIPWEALADPTRPTSRVSAQSDVREFVANEIEYLFWGYRRDYLQSQNDYFEVLVEKNTVNHMAKRVTDKYQIPCTSGRGFCSIDPWHDVYERYIASRKDRLVLIILSDYDPEGEMIPHVAGRTLRDDFGVDDLSIVKAGVTREQIEKYNLPPMNFAKESSSNYAWFLERNNGDDTVYELEALPPEVMLSDLEDAIKSVIDVEMFNMEVDLELDEAEYLEESKIKAMEALGGLMD